MTENRANQLDLPVMWQNNEDPHQTNYTVSVDASDRASTGISAAERAHTANVLANPDSTPSSLIRPGHVLPLRAKPGGVSERPGHTEAAIDLLRLAGLQQVGLMAEMVNDDGTMMRVPELFSIAERFDLSMTNIHELSDYMRQRANGETATSNRIRLEAETLIPTKWGEFKVRGYYDARTTAEHVALIAGNPGKKDVLVRLHSECITGEAFGSLKCECGPQLDAALEKIQQDPEGGMVLYLRGQEGRGIGLLNKLKAYALQEQGMDTVDANLALGFPSEAREYGAAVEMLRDLGVESVRLLTNNPEKEKFLENAGIPVTEISPLLVGLSEENQGYLDTKRDRMGHMIPETDK